MKRILHESALDQARRRSGRREFDAAYAAIAAAQPRAARRCCCGREEAAHYPFALIVPLKFAPGRARRWLSWGLAAAVATYRQFGVPAYLDDELFLHGRDIAQSRACSRSANARSSPRAS